MNIFSFFSSLYKNTESESESQENIENSHIHFINNMVEENKDKFIQESMILLEFIDKSFNTFKTINQRLDNLEKKIKILDKLEINFKKNEYTDSDSDIDTCNDTCNNTRNDTCNDILSNDTCNNILSNDISNDICNNFLIDNNIQYNIDTSRPFSEESVFI